jgi:hypothetical protein
VFGLKEKKCTLLKKNEKKSCSKKIFRFFVHPSVQAAGDFHDKLKK